VLTLSACTGEENKEPECAEYEDLVDGECVDNRSEFEIAMDNMEALESVEMTMTLKDVPLFGDFVTVVKIEGDSSEMELLGVTVYTFMEDGTYFMLEPNQSDGWEKSEVDDEDLDGVDDFMFEESDFDLVDGVYVANTSIDDMDNIEITLEDGYIVLISFSTTEDGMTFEAEVEFDKFDDVTVELPEYE